jgi:hypothetical protein
VYELEVDLPLYELLEWRAFWKIEAAAEEKAIEKSRREAANAPRSRRR